MPSRSSVQQPVRFFELWGEAYESRRDEIISVRQGPFGSAAVEHSLGSLAHTTIRVAHVLREMYEGKQVSRAAVFATGCLELAPLYHALWLLGITVISIPSTQHSRQIVAQINNSDADILIHGAEQSMRLAALLPQISSVRYRLVLASSGSGALKGGEGVSYLHELKRAPSSCTSADFSLSEFSSHTFSSGVPALVVFTTDDPIESHGIAFSEEALIRAARLQSKLYPTLADGEARRVWFLMQDKSLVRLMHTVALPLVTRVAVCEHDSATSTDRYASFVKSHGISTIVVDDLHLEVCEGCIAQQSGEFEVIFVSSSPVPKRRVEALHSVLVPAYGRTELGGVVASGRKGALHFCSQGNPLGLELLSCGHPLEDVKLSVVKDDGAVISNSRPGEIVVTSPQNMLLYHGSRAGDAYLSPRNALHSGDAGYWSFDLQGMPHLVITGRSSATAERDGVPVHISDVELSLYALPGVEAARVVAFPHLLYGREIAAYVIVKDGATVTRSLVWEALSQRFTWSHIPKIVLFGREAERLPLPSHAALLETLQAFESTEFPEGMRS